MITSTTGSQEHFLQSYSTKSGIVIKRGEESYEAQSLYDLSRVKWRNVENPVTKNMLRPIDKNACFILLNLNNFMAPTQIPIPIMSQHIQLSERIARTKRPIEAKRLNISHILTNPKTYLLNVLQRKKISLEHIKV